MSNGNDHYLGLTPPH
ncbi:unnamed protein product, partial [Rotaria magnacalcarata]